MAQENDPELPPSIAFIRDGDEIAVSWPGGLYRFPLPADDVMEAMCRLLQQQDYGEQG